MPDRFEKLEKLISQVPALCSPVANGTYENGFWWIKFSLDTSHPLVWNVVQAFAYVINYLSISERLSTVFYPIAQPPDVEKNQEACLEWIIESTSEDFNPSELAEWLDARLPAIAETQDWRL